VHAVGFAAALFLLSDEAAWITGVVIDVDGGNHLMGVWTPMVTDGGGSTPT